jgi:hypothetical protein
VPKNWGKNVTLTSSISLEGMGASMNMRASSLESGLLDPSKLAHIRP